MCGNVVDMAAGIIIGASFGKIVSSLVSDVIMPPIGLLMGGIDFSGPFFDPGMGGHVAAESASAPIIKYGVFINTVLDLVIDACAIFMVIKGLNTMKKKEEEKPAAPPAPCAEKKLLGEIRYLLTNR